MNKLYIDGLIDRYESIKKQFVLIDSEGETDPLKEYEFTYNNVIIHRFYGRVLFLLSYTCPRICAFCTRKRLHSKKFPDKEDIDNGIKYIKNRNDIYEVIFSGGDPLWADKDIVKYVYDELEDYKIRIHSRMPLMIPSRVYDYDFLYNKNTVFVTHFNHPDELQKEVIESLNFIKDKGSILLNQSVLLKGINDSVEVLMELFMKLYEIGVIPYYLHQIDNSIGGKAFEVDIGKGLEIMEQLAKMLSGVAVPHYVKDIPYGECKKRLF